MGKNPPSSSTPKGPDPRPEAVDTRPEKCPYTGKYITIFFGGPDETYGHFDDRVAIVSRSLVANYARLASWFFPPDLAIRLNTTADAGHVFVHFLMTRTYQCLKPKGSSPHKKCVSEFETSVRVYSLAHRYEVFPLEALAKNEMERLGQKLQAPQIFDVMKDIQLHPGAINVWLRKFIKSRVDAFISQSPASSIVGSAKSLSDALSVPAIFFGAALELYREKLGTARSDSSRGTPCPSQKEPAGVIPPEKSPACNPELDQSSVSEFSPEPQPEGSLGSTKTMRRVRINKKKVIFPKYFVVAFTSIPNESGQDKQRAEPREKQGEKTSGGIFTQNSSFNSRPFITKPGEVQQPPPSSNVPSLFGGIFGNANQNPPSGSTTATRNLSLPKFNPLNSVTAEKASPGDAFHGMENVPSTRGALTYYEVLGATAPWPQVDRFLHICVQPEWQAFSPEELRWKHELDSQSECALIRRLFSGATGQKGH
ncbi:hypothetical protein GGS23DRAFT_560089 [Durotheca rogersii]|uniref:uncharacterized protein n=1 Tax=Durotheca rogersii TaxID=419775 RepID=UPI0022203A4B|nr:uncharacterized protein GGS23DRAFT_560089 [Durotheca rogersii]KAI5865633.1 hypothetical protein GGS23DRAFT_560089 [Durotheca rogersii]